MSAERLRKVLEFGSRKVSARCHRRELCVQQSPRVLNILRYQRRDRSSVGEHMNAIPCVAIAFVMSFATSSSTRSRLNSHIVYLGSGITYPIGVLTVGGA